ncbi:MAG: hypothetical protein HY560_08680 [Gemmatimonadetes bacterium]|nr:hypothetical protein [Gemmatimonadota bacterium]
MKAPHGAEWVEFGRRLDGMVHALEGGLWLHRFRLDGEPMAHLVSSNRVALLAAGKRLGMRREWLQHKPLKFPPTGELREAWHWDLRGGYLERAATLAGPRR